MKPARRIHIRRRLTNQGLHTTHRLFAVQDIDLSYCNQDKINSLKRKIDAAIQSHGWQPNSRAFARYNELKSTLDGIDLDSRVRDCGRHKTAAPKKSGHSCSYCSLSLQQIYHQLDDIYKKIYSSSDRKAAKAKVMGQVNALYRCCTDSGCSKHAAAWKSGGDGYKAKITERYNRINGI